MRESESCLRARDQMAVTSELRNADSCRGERRQFWAQHGQGEFYSTHFVLYIFFPNTVDDLLEIQCIVFQSFPVVCTLASLTQNGQLMGGQRGRGHVIWISDWWVGQAQMSRDDSMMWVTSPGPVGIWLLWGSSGPLHIFIKVHLVYQAADIQPWGMEKGNEFVVITVNLGESMLQNANVLFPLKVNFLKRLTAASANGKWRSHWIWIEHREHKLILWDGYDSVSVNIKYLFQETGKIDCKLEKDTELTLL